VPLISLLASALEEGEGWIGSWTPGIGDPTFVGWLTVIAYLAAAYLCRRVDRRVRAPRPAPGTIEARALTSPLAPLAIALLGRKRLLLRLPERARLSAMWRGFSIVLLLLGINKQLDLQSAITEIGRMIARDLDLISVRRTLQVYFIGIILLIGAWILRSVMLLARGNVRRLWPALVGTVFILVFVAIRALSFHHIDYMLGGNLGGFRLNWAVELGGIALIIFGAGRELRALGPRLKRVIAVPVGKPNRSRPPTSPRP
jgi:hypothetical protein